MFTLCSRSVPILLSIAFPHAHVSSAGILDGTQHQFETKIRDKVPCSVCTAKTTFDPDSPDDTATFELYYHHSGQDLNADIELMLLLGDQYRTVTIKHATLIDRTTSSFELVAGDDWSWDEVDYVLVDLIPTPQP